MQVYDKSSFDHIGFIVVFDTELGGDAIGVALVQGQWRFHHSPLFFASDVDQAIAALQLARTLVRAIDAEPHKYKELLDRVKAGGAL